MAANDVENNQQPGEELCMLCKSGPQPGESFVLCILCQAPWHKSCLICCRESGLITDDEFGCAECDNRIKDDDYIILPPGKNNFDPSSTFTAADSSMVARILAIQSDQSLTEEEKARKRQELLSGGPTPRPTHEPSMMEVEDDSENNKCKGKLKLTVEPHDDASDSDAFDESVNCTICLNIPERPVTTPCGHNFCLKCFKHSTRLNRACALCRKPIPSAMQIQPRINLTLVSAIRMAKMLKMKLNGTGEGSTKFSDYVHNQDRPDKAYTTERAKRKGKANAASGRIFVTVPIDHFGPILAENDPERDRGVLVGDTWEDRLECRQWGGHFPPIKGIAGQQDHGAQSVVLSGGYQDDVDYGDWFLYTGSGGRDLSGNRRTNKDQSFDQEFKSGNESLRLSCKNGYPVRVIRSYKDKRSSYAPEKGLRYDGIYRVEKCWRTIGVQGFKVCRYLFVRCDNDPAPWTSDVHGDRPRSLPIIEELETAFNVTERKESPAWDFDEANACWKWMRPQPMSKQKVNAGSSGRKMPTRTVFKPALSAAARRRLQKEFGCLICRQVLFMPVTTACGHNFCKACFQGAFAGKSFVRERTAGGRTLRTQKIVMKCPACPVDLSEYLNNIQVNIELKNLIAKQMAEYENYADEEHIEKETVGANEDLPRISNNLKENFEEVAYVDDDDDDDDYDDDDDDDDDDDGSEDPEMELNPEKPAKLMKVDDQVPEEDNKP